jgi:hypothetical protein
MVVVVAVAVVVVVVMVVVVVVEVVVVVVMVVVAMSYRDDALLQRIRFSGGGDGGGSGRLGVASFSRSSRPSTGRSRCRGVASLGRSNRCEHSSIAGEVARAILSSCGILRRLHGSFCVLGSKPLAFTIVHRDVVHQLPPGVSD